MTGKLVSLSEQNLLDCTNNTKYMEAKCDGGVVDGAYEMTIDNPGIDTEESYPYVSGVAILINIKFIIYSRRHSPD